MMKQPLTRAAFKGETEAALQKACARRLDDLAGEMGFVWFHPPNSIRTGHKQASMHKAFGMKAGVPDICIMLRDGRTVFIELKAAWGSLKPEQKQFHADLRRLGHQVHIVKEKLAMQAAHKVEAIVRGA